MAILGTSGNDTIVGTTGNDTIFANGGGDSVAGSAGTDQIYGGAGSDTVFGGAAKDVISGGSGNDQLYGGNGDDVISGGDGNDLINGGDGADVIIGGTGVDKLWGGADRDVFTYVSRADSGVGLGARDIIGDFQHGYDRIDLHSLNVSAGMIKLSGWYGGTSAATAYAQLLQIDFDNDGRADLEIQLNGTHGGVTMDDLYL